MSSCARPKAAFLLASACSFFLAAWTPPGEALVVPVARGRRRAVIGASAVEGEVTLTSTDLGRDAGAAGTTFGDIMGGALDTDLSILNAEDLHLTAMERVALTTNGNLQRVLSAFHNHKVSVKVVRNSMDRRTVCLASSLVTCRSKRGQTLIDEGRAGIGQIFTILGELPQFNLVEIGKSPCYCRRIYTLTSPSVVCHIEEYLPSDLFDPKFLEMTNDGFDEVMRNFYANFSSES